MSKPKWVQATQKKNPGTGPGRVCCVQLAVAEGFYLPFFAAGFFAELFVVFFETGFLAAAMAFLLSWGKNLLSRAHCTGFIQKVHPKNRIFTQFVEEVAGAPHHPL